MEYLSGGVFDLVKEEYTDIGKNVFSNDDKLGGEYIEEDLEIYDLLPDYLGGSKISESDYPLNSSAPTVIDKIVVSMLFKQDTPRQVDKLPLPKKERKFYNIIDLSQYNLSQNNKVNEEIIYSQLKDYKYLNLFLKDDILFTKHENKIIYNKFAKPVVLEFTLPSNYEYYMEVRPSKKNRKFKNSNPPFEIESKKGLITRLFGISTLIVLTEDVKITNAWIIDNDSLVRENTIEETFKKYKSRTVKMIDVLTIFKKIIEIAKKNDDSIINLDLKPIK